MSCLMTFLLLLLCFLIVSRQDKGIQKTSVVLRSGNGEQFRLVPEFKDDAVNFFIPSGFTLDDITVSGDGKQAEITEMKNVPTINVEVKIGDIDKVNNDHEKKEKLRARFFLYDENGNLIKEELGSLKGRGNTSWQFYDKKPYNITFDDAIEVFGMDEARKWCLLANETDPYFISNALVFDLASGLDLSFVPEYRFVNLYIDGEYNGLYQICEKIETGKNRLNLKGSDAFFLETDLNMTTDKIGDYFITSGNNIFEFQYPEKNNKESIERIREELEVLEADLKDLNSNHWKDKIDIDSWARVYLIDELFENVDGGFCSVFLYKDENGRFVRGPIWDYDRSFTAGPRVIVTGNEHKFTNQINMNYNCWLLLRPDFQERVKEIYDTEFVPVIGSIGKNAENIEKQIFSSLCADRIRWDKDVPEEHSADIGSFMMERGSFLDEYFADREGFCRIQIEDDQQYLRNFIIRKGETVYDCVGLDRSLLNVTLHDKENGEIFNLNRFIYDDLCLVRQTEYEESIPDVRIYEFKKDVGMINVIFIVAFLFSFVSILYIMGKRMKDGKISS